MVDVVAPAVAPAPGRGPRAAADASWVAWGGLVVLVGARAYRALLLVLVAAATVPALLTWSSHVVRTGSMEPSISVGDVVVARPFAPTEDVPVGRVLVFADPADPAHERLLVHRVVSDRGDGTWATAGDANQENDSTPAVRADFRSRALILVPYVGRPVTWLLTGDLVLLLGWTVLTVLAFVLAARRGPFDRRGHGGPGGPGGGPGPTCRLVARVVRPPVRHRRTTPTSLAVRAVTAPAVALLLVCGSAASWSSTAHAAFSAGTTNPGSGWTVSTMLAARLVLAPPADAVRGTVPLTATLSASPGSFTSVRIDYAPADTTTWRTVCTKTAAPYTCDWTTTSLTNQAYDLRAVAVSPGTTLVSETVPDVTVDNTAPTVVMQDPGTPLRGTVTLTASASDAHSGVDRVLVQYAASGTSTWRDVCSSTDEPATCRLDTTTLADGAYSFRAVATDAAGGSATSPVVTNRTVDNRVASVSVTDPGAFLSGTVQVAASAYAPAGVASVRLQRATGGTTTWTDLCLDTTAPYACTWDTTTAANGLYDLRAVLTDTAGRTTTSATLAGRRVDNSPVRATDVQTAQGGAVVARVDQGDRIIFTWSHQVRLTSITPGWTGAAQAVTVRLRDGNLLGTGATGDTLDVLRPGSTVSLGTVNLRQSFIKNLRTAQFAATMTATTTVVDGVTATQVVVTLGAQTSGSALPTVPTAAAMVWTPSTAVVDLNGRAVASTPATETGASDRDF